MKSKHNKVTFPCWLCCFNLVMSCQSLWWKEIPAGSGNHPLVSLRTTLNTTWSRAAFQVCKDFQGRPLTYLTDNYCSEWVGKTFSGLKSYSRCPPWVPCGHHAGACTLLVPACFGSASKCPQQPDPSPPPPRTSLNHCFSCMCLLWSEMIVSAWLKTFKTPLSFFFFWDLCILIVYAAYMHAAKAQNMEIKPPQQRKSIPIFSSLMNCFGVDLTKQGAYSALYAPQGGCMVRQLTLSRIPLFLPCSDGLKKRWCPLCLCVFCKRHFPQMFLPEHCQWHFPVT